MIAAIKKAHKASPAPECIPVAPDLCGADLKLSLGLFAMLGVISLKLPWPRPFRVSTPKLRRVVVVHLRRKGIGVAVVFCTSVLHAVAKLVYFIIGKKN